ncbi:MAG TPA: phosphotransferase [Actinomycetales bacterium]|nr:phosphotransferase [Actinomycetales bacterium]
MEVLKTGGAVVTCVNALGQVRLRTVRAARSRLAHPLFRSGYTLVLNSTLSAVVGVAFWLLAARVYQPAVVGRNSAALSAMMFLAGVAQLNLMSSLLRFLPTSGRGARRMAALSYLVAGTLSAVAAVVFLVGLGTWSPALVPLLHEPLTAVSFIFGTMALSILTLQTCAFVALRHAGTATLINQAFNILKLVLLAAFAILLPRTGVYFAWVSAAVLVVASGAVLLFARTVRTFASEPRNIPALPDLARFAGPDYVASLAWIAATSLVPVLVLNLTDASHAAVFALTWSVTLVLYGVPEAFGQALVAHTTRELSQLDERHTQVLKASLALLAPVVVLLVVSAPLLLRPFGPWYATQGAGTLRLLASSSLPGTVVGLTVSRARVRRHMVTVTAALISVCVLVIGLTLLLVPRVGIVGAGLAWLLGESAVAAVIGVVALSGLMIRSPRAAVPPSVRAEAVRAVKDAGWLPERRLQTVSDTAVLIVSDANRAAVLKVAATARGMAALRREEEVLTRLADDDRLGSWRQMIPAVLDTFEFTGGRALLTNRLEGRDARERFVHLDGSDHAVAAIGPLHRLDTGRCTADDELLERWVTEPAERLRHVVPAYTRLQPGVGRLQMYLYDQLSQRTLTMGWVHGDFYPGNVLVDANGLVSGVVDTAQTQQRGLPVLDLAHWVLTLPGDGGPDHLGARVAGRLDQEQCWTESETKFLLQAPGGGELPGRVVLLLTWLRHVDSNLVKSERYANNPIWLRRNVFPVLRKVRDE